MKKKKIKHLKKCVREIVSKNYHRLSRKDRKILYQFDKYQTKRKKTAYAWYELSVQKLSKGLTPVLRIVSVLIKGLNS